MDKNKLFIILIILLAITLPLYTGTYLTHVFTTICIFLSLALSWDMMLRTGQLSFGTAGFFGLGAYVSALTVANLGLNPILSLILGGIFAGLIAFGLGFIVLRLREIYFAIVTLALTHVFQVIVKNLSELTGGASGLTLKKAIFGGTPIKYTGLSW